jgi:hypothetical protein
MLHGQIGGFSASEYFVDVSCALPELISRIEPVGNQPARLGIKGEWIDRGQPIACCQRNDKIAIRGK